MTTRFLGRARGFVRSANLNGAAHTKYCGRIECRLTLKSKFRRQIQNHA